MTITKLLIHEKKTIVSQVTRQQHNSSKTTNLFSSPVNEVIVHCNEFVKGDDSGDDDNDSGNENNE